MKFKLDGEEIMEDFTFLRETLENEGYGECWVKCCPDYHILDCYHPDKAEKVKELFSGFLIAQEGKMLFLKPLKFATTLEAFKKEVGINV